MSRTKSLSMVLAGPAVLGLGMAAISTANSGQPQSVRCEIRVTHSGNGIALEGVVFAKTVTRGSYSLRISKSGGSGTSDIDQSGDFNAAPGAATTLGMISLGGGGSYVAKLKVMAQGRTYECTERVGGTL